jgi:hypothetical protein
MTLFNVFQEKNNLIDILIIDIVMFLGYKIS